MSKQKFIAILACLAFIGSLKAARAADNQTKSDAGSQNLDQITDLLNALDAAGAIDVTEDGRVVVKKSVTDRLRAQGRMNSAVAGHSSICSKAAK